MELIIIINEEYSRSINEYPYNYCSILKKIFKATREFNYP